MANVELEEMGEDTENMAESTAKLRELVKGLTGFDILKDDGKTFKSIYDIVVGIGKEWENLSDINQAALLEKLAGKNQSNALAAALQNYKEIEKIYSTAEKESQGSAMREQKNYEQSIQYSIDRLKAIAQDLITKLLNSKDVKEIVDSAANGLESLGNTAEKIAPFLSTVMKLLEGILTLASKLGGALPAILGGGFAFSKLKKSENFGKPKCRAFLNVPNLISVYMLKCIVF